MTDLRSPQRTLSDARRREQLARLLRTFVELNNDILHRSEIILLTGALASLDGEYVEKPPG
jgi:hypothetical protein